MSGCMTLMLGVGGAPGVINGTANASETGAPAGITLQNDGTYLASGSAGGNWVNPATAVIAAQYDVKVDVTAGSIDSGTTGSFLNLGTSRAWQKNAAGTATLTFTWRETATGTVRKVQTGVTITVS